ncbi:MAG: polymer-forming cytoskeletal protein [Acidobacteriota bacterium]
MTLLLGAAPLAAQDEEASAAAEAGASQAEKSAAELLEPLRDDFRVIELRHGWALEPREDRGDFSLIEINRGVVTVDGQQVDTERLRRYVDEAAGPIMEVARREDQADGHDDSRDRRRRGDTQVSFASGVTVDSDEVVDEVVLLSGHLEMRGEVEGGVTVVMGSAAVDGRVGGDLVVIGGPVELESAAEVHGDVVTVGGRIERASGSVVHGEIVQVAFGDFDFEGLDVDWGLPGGSSGFFDGLDLVRASILTGMVWALVSCVFFVAPKRTAEVATRLRLEPWKSGLVGLVMLIMLLPLLLLLIVVLLVSIVGIPLIFVLVPLLTIVLLFFYFLGFGGASIALGEQIRRRFAWRESSPYVLLLAGFFLIYTWTIVGEALLFTPWPLRLLGYGLLLFGWVIKFVSWTAGLGAAILHQFAPLGRIPPEDRWNPPVAPAAPAPAPEKP